MSAAALFDVEREHQARFLADQIAALRQRNLTAEQAQRALWEKLERRQKQEAGALQSFADDPFKYMTRRLDAEIVARGGRSLFALDLPAKPLGNPTYRRP